MSESDANNAFLAQQISPGSAKKCYFLNAPIESESEPNQQEAEKGADEDREQNNETNTAAAANSKRRGNKIVESLVVSNSAEMFNNVNSLPDNKYYCRICNRVYKTLNTIMAHLRGRHLRCESKCAEPGCDHVSYTKYERNKHEKEHEKKNGKGEKIRKRGYRAIPIPPLPREHEIKTQILQRATSVNGMQKQMDGSEKGRVTYTCNDCGSVFYNSYQATRHREIHDKLPQQCYYCGEIRRGEMDLRVHYVRKHREEGVRAYSCTGCRSEFTTLEMFNEHMNRNSNNYHCRLKTMRQEVYYGEIPERVNIDPVTRVRVEFFRRKNFDREARNSVSSSSSKSLISEAQNIPVPIPPGAHQMMYYYAQPPQIEEIDDEDFYNMKRVCPPRQFDYYQQNPIFQLPNGTHYQPQSPQGNQNFTGNNHFLSNAYSQFNNNLNPMINGMNGFYAEMQHNDQNIENFKPVGEIIEKPDSNAVPAPETPISNQLEIPFMPFSIDDLQPYPTATDQNGMKNQLRPNSSMRPSSSSSSSSSSKTESTVPEMSFETNDDAELFEFLNNF